MDASAMLEAVLRREIKRIEYLQDRKDKMEDINIRELNKVDLPNNKKRRMDNEGKEWETVSSIKRKQVH